MTWISKLAKAICFVTYGHDEAAAATMYLKDTLSHLLLKSISN